MKIDFRKELKSIDGKPLREGAAPAPEAEDKRKTLTLGTVAIMALLNPPPQRPMAGKDKARCYTLSMDIHTAAEPLEITVEDAALIKDLVAEIYLPLVVGQVWNMLELKNGERDT